MSHRKGRFSTSDQKEKEIVEIVLPQDEGEGLFDMEHGSVHFIGTATVLFRYAGFTILTDPNFLHKGDKVHIGYGLTSERVTDPALDMEQLPPIDLVVLSHMHEDHFDRIVERKLDKMLPIITNPIRLRLYISGDTLLYDQLREIPRRFPDIDLGLLHLGGTKVMGMLLTMDGKQGAQALRIVAPKAAIPIHYNDTKSSNRHWMTSRKRFVRLTLLSRSSI